MALLNLLQSTFDLVLDDTIQS